MAKFYQNPFYDYVFGSVNRIIPSKRIGYKQDPITKNVLKRKTSKGVLEFDEFIKTWLSNNSYPEWPLRGHLLIIISASLIPSEYKERDVDGFTKTLLDSLKGIAYLDDRQVDVVYANKYLSNSNNFMVAIKTLPKKETWYLPELFSDVPYPHSPQASH